MVREERAVEGDPKKVLTASKGAVREEALVGQGQKREEDVIEGVK